MKKLIQRYFIIILLSFLPVQILSAQEMPFRRHFIIVVDQTLKRDNLANMNILYRSISMWLQGKDPSSLLPGEGSTIPQAIPFDKHQDAISLFAFGMTGSGMGRGSGDYWRIHQACALGKETPAEWFNDINGSLIKKRARYIDGKTVSRNRTDKEDVSSFLLKEMLPLFNMTDPQHINIGSQSGITLSHFIYPLIMNFISKEESASEYYLIVVSDFKSGQYSNNDKEDWNWVDAMAVNKSSYHNYFEHQLNVLRAPFIQADYFHFQSGGIGARCTRLMYKGVISKSQLYLGSNLNLDQHKGEKFNLSKAIITFDKDKNTTIDSIGVALYEGDNLLCYRTITRGDDEAAKLLTDDGSRDYNIPAQNDLNMGKSSLGDITVKYIFFTMTHDGDGKNVLPVSLTSQQTIEKSSITYVNEQLRKAMTIIIVFILAVIIVLYLFWRGRKKKVDVSVLGFAQKYIDVTKDRGTVELPCWFYTEGHNRNKIKIQGSVGTKYGYSILGYVTLYVRLQEAKPDGFNYYINSDSCNNFTKVKLHNGKFEFDLEMTFNPEKINPSELHHCSIMIDFRVETSFLRKVYRTDIGLSPRTVEFYFIEDLGRSWVGFDPGTSGSCMAVGSPTGALANPSIAMVEAKEGTGTTEIIPSRIILNKDLANKTIDSMTPGEDYQYGVEADQSWGAQIQRGFPHYQSIKKLLGYKRGGDKIVVKTSTGQIDFTGVDMAHLLIKGLDADLVKFIDQLPKSDQERLINGSTLPQRAVVAIPNNYTLPKILDMIESISRLGEFKEIRFIYEAEGVLFNYLRKSFKESSRKSSEIVMVYDMGGATINLSVFKIQYVHKDGSVFYNISTLGRIGYGVGGDNIDVALMEHIFNWLPISEDERHEIERRNKTEILAAMLRLKKNIINKVNGKTNISDIDVIYNATSFKSFIEDLLEVISTPQKRYYISDLQRMGNIFEDDSSEKYSSRIVHEFLDSDELEDFVYSKVGDAVTEMMSYPEVSPLPSINKIIFAGRSTTFPRIRHKVTNVVAKLKSNNYEVVNLDDNPDEIKTAVAYGACWYGIYNGLVTLDNSRLSSAYGFKITTEQDTTLDILLDQNSKFGRDNMVHGMENIESLFPGDGQTVSFYQVMGSGNSKDIFSEENRFKVNFLIGIPVVTKTQSISIDVGRNNLATCSVTFNTGMTDSKTDIDIENRDIGSENDWAYVFATTTDDNKVINFHSTKTSRSRKRRTTTDSDTSKSATSQPTASRPNAPLNETTWSDGRKKRF